MQPQLGAAQPQLGSAAQPQLASQPHEASQQLVAQQQCLAAMRAFRRANKPGFEQHGSQHESAQPHEGSAQPQLGSQAEAQPQLGSHAEAQPHEGSQHESQHDEQQSFMRRQAFLQQSLRRLHNLCLGAQQDAHGSQQQDISQPQDGSAQPQLGSQAAAQPQLGSAAQPQPPSIPKNAEAFPALVSAMATPSVDSRYRFMGEGS